MCCLVNYSLKKIKSSRCIGLFHLFQYISTCFKNFHCSFSAVINCFVSRCCMLIVIKKEYYKIYKIQYIFLLNIVICFCLRDVKYKHWLQEMHLWRTLNLYKCHLHKVYRQWEYTPIGTVLLEVLLEIILYILFILLYTFYCTCQ